MRDRFLRSTITIALSAVAVSAVISVSIGATSDETPAAGPRTPWGEPDLQGLWTDETDTPLQRSPKFGTQEFFTEAERAELDQQRSQMKGRDERAERGTTADVAGAYNDEFTPKKRTGLRTSRIVDPPNGRLPPQTPEAQKMGATEREFRLALLQSSCCSRPTPARTMSPHAGAANTIPSRRRDTRNSLPATTPRQSIATTIRKIPHWRFAA
jgi:hypothetical protein